MITNVMNNHDHNDSKSKVTSTAAAKMLNIFPRKGCIAEVIHDLDDNDEDDDGDKGIHNVDDNDEDDDDGDRKDFITEVIHNHDNDLPIEEQY